MAAYESDITRFLKKLKHERPHLDAEQQNGRAIWWDKDAIDLEQTRRWREARVPQKSYPYQTES
ncbi:MAG: DUF3460 family protein [Burkholderiales bacterium]